MIDTVIEKCVEVFLGYGLVGVIALVFGGMFVWGVVILFRKFVGLFPAITKWFESHANLADTATQELPAMRRVVENSTEAVKECSRMAQQCHEITVQTATEMRQAREHTILRDQNTAEKLGSIETKVDEVNRKLD